jgi:ATP-dependent Clp protease ATP-binding subunit ClpA
VAAKDRDLPVFKQLFGGNPMRAPKAQTERDPCLANRRAQRAAEEKISGNYWLSMTAKPERARIDKIVGRKRNPRVLQILNSRQKNNPCLIVRGVGLNAIAEGLCLRK